MSNIFDKFERSVKNSLEGFEVPGAKDEWAAMNAILSRAKVLERRRRVIKYSSLLLGLLLFSTGVYYFESQENGGFSHLFELGKDPKFTMKLEEIEPKSNVTITNPNEEGKNFQESIVEESAIETDSEGSSILDEEIKVEKRTSSKSTDGSKKDVKINNVRTKKVVRKSSKKKKAVPEKKVYRQIYSSFNGRDEKRSVLKLDIPRPTAQFGFDNTEGCAGLLVQFQPINNDGDYEYFWSFGDKNFSNKENPSHKYEKAGNFRVSLTIKYGDDEFVKYNHPISIMVHPNPKVDFDWSMDKSNLITKLKFRNKSAKYNSVEWDFGDGEFTAKINPSHGYKSIGEYNVTLDVINEFNCSSKLSRRVAITRKYNFTAPKLFTPNGDGRNDEFMPDGLSMIGNRFSLKIYKSSGEMIYETDDKSKPWDGKDNNGRIEDGTYIWILTVINPAGVDDVQQGSVVVNK